jgi:hypothetical protein
VAEDVFALERAGEVVLLGWNKPGAALLAVLGGVDEADGVTMRIGLDDGAGEEPLDVAELGVGLLEPGALAEAFCPAGSQ